MEKNPSHRIVIIDALRGFALGGVALVHMTEQYIASPPPDGLMEVTNGILDQIFQGIIGFLIIGKFFALFSILFGLSFFIQMESTSNKGKNYSKRFLWRSFLLLLIGYTHHLFYKGDILTIYALLAPFLIPFYRIKNTWILLVAGLMLVSVPRFISFSIFGSESAFGLPSFMDANSEFNTSYIRTLKEGSIGEVFSANARIGMLQKMDFQVGFFARFYLTYGYFLIGLWLGKISLFEKVQEYIPKIKNWLRWSILFFVIALIITGGVFALSPQPVDFKHWLHVIAINAYDWSNICLTAIILCSFILLYQKNRGNKILSFFAPYGRMALTNYILQSIIGTFILFGWGLGYLGKIRVSYLVIIAIVLISLQTIGSRVWLHYFRYGPLEWIWRCTTIGKIQPLKK
ncbi:DUF418 domain-containing protein [Aquimarina sp. MMG016]|uniref:DUF418 domain-containing protein n=1 Tax=Aquimarina sp. MMG016 TaxID=2822690 RepID=UPI001B3A4B94|nr:DUF418 domain-containing protein [Aquimarina sp. MMG016]MBQ4820183.1 DUF418 domain-containing protein [Aquimarina sp. MMG016]